MTVNPISEFAMRLESTLITIGDSECAATEAWEAFKLLATNGLFGNGTTTRRSCCLGKETVVPNARFFTWITSPRGPRITGYGRYSSQASHRHSLITPYTKEGVIRLDESSRT